MIMNKWLILDKPEGMTSTKAGALVKRTLGIKTLGHAGTLDPFATGVLPLALGESTKSMSYVLHDIKEYEFELTFGKQRDTGDREGNIIATNPHRPTSQDILKALPAFLGHISQIPPVYSALKIGGKRACDLARQGQVVKMKPRTVEVREFELLDIPSNDKSRFRVLCGPGTYIRSLGSDLAISLGTLGYVSQLRRTRVGKFTLKDAVKLDIILNEGRDNLRPDWFISIRNVLDDIPALPLLDMQKEINLRQGQSLPLEDFDQQELENTQSEEIEGQTVLLLSQNQELALAIVAEGRVYPKRLFLMNER